MTHIYMYIYEKNWKKVGFAGAQWKFEVLYRYEGGVGVGWHYRAFGALIWCFDPQYCFDGRVTSAGIIGRKKFFFLDFGGQKSDFLDFSQNWTILCRMVNIGFLRTFRAPKSQFPAKYHISGHYIEYLRILKNRIFCDFSRFLRIFSIWFVAGIGRN